MIGKHETERFVDRTMPRTEYQSLCSQYRKIKRNEMLTIPKNDITRHMEGAWYLICFNQQQHQGANYRPYIYHREELMWWYLTPHTRWYQDYCSWWNVERAA